nr:MAG TPA: hypothetical protein [Caudoviricetes sp.]
MMVVLTTPSSRSANRVMPFTTVSLAVMLV